MSALPVARAPAGGPIEQRARRIEGHARRWRRLVAATLGAAVRDGVDRAQGETLAVVLDPRRVVADEGVRDGDEATSEEALVELPVGAVDGDGGVATDAAAGTHGEGAP